MVNDNMHLAQMEDIQDFQDRPYQQKIIDVCIQKNSIVYLPTGSGKSYIAIQVIRHFSKELERTYLSGGKRSVFLCNTTYLAKQQAETIEEILPYNVSLLTGEQCVDSWNAAKWRIILDENHIIVATPQVILDALSHSFISFSQINVIVFDECHHGRNSHPYKEIMMHFDSNEETRIVGLSGMLIGIDNSIKPDKVQCELQKLEATFRSTIITVNEFADILHVHRCSTNASESFVRYLNEPPSSCVDFVRNLLFKANERLKDIRLDNYKTINSKSLLPTIPRKVKDLILYFKEFDYQCNDMGSFGGYLCLLSILIQLELTKRSCDSEKFRQIVKFCITIVEHGISKMEQNYGFKRFTNGESSFIQKNVTSKVQKLLLLLKKRFSSTECAEDLQCLVFVERRMTAKVLYHVLKAYAETTDTLPIKPDFMVGNNAEMSESIENVLSSSYNSVALENFKNKKTNCIVTTSVLEEGIDLQSCNLVLMYDSPKTYRGYVQSRGRARADNSYYYVLIKDEDATKFCFQVNDVWKKVELELGNQLIMKSLDRQPPTDEDILNGQEEVWEPFVTPVSKSVLRASSSVSLLNHYAMKLPADRFTNTNVYWERVSHEDGKVGARLKLPEASLIKEEICSDPQSNVRLAKQNAAFKACISLYECGELNDNLIPVDTKEKIEQYHDTYFPHWEKYSADKKSAGTKCHRRYHKIKMPQAITNCAATVNEFSFIHRIIIRPKFDTPSEALAVFRDLIANMNTYGILTSKKLPQLCKMTLFQSYGETEVEIESEPVAVVLTSNNQLLQLQRFHIAVFRDVLQTWKSFFVLDKTSLLIVPLTGSSRINWNIVREFQGVQAPQSLSHDEIMNMNFTRDSYYHRVVNPVYRETDQNYVVINVHEHLSPLSPFPNLEFSSFKEYCEEKFSVTVRRNDQPMIEVKGISKNLNIFFPGAGTSGKQRRHEKLHMTEMYVPELCHNYKYPADLWLKATLLPCILNRLHYLLLAEELRMWLIDEEIDDGDKHQIYKLDVDYGNYDEREKNLEKIDREEEIYGAISNIEELKKQLMIEQTEHSSNEASYSRARLLWKKSELPIDIDRNWLIVTDVDLDYYYNFLNKNQNINSPMSLSHLKELNRTKTNYERFLTDSNRDEIKLIDLKGAAASVQQKDLIKVLTTSNAGDVFDMERYEVLGDAFLKFTTSLFLYKKHDKWHEGHLTSLKGRIVSNRNLYYIGNNLGLSEMIKSSNFDPFESLPPSIGLPVNIRDLIAADKTMLTRLYYINALSADEVLSGEMSGRALKTFKGNYVDFAIQHDEPADDEGDGQDDLIEKSLLVFIKEHHVGDKVVADAVEALLGVVVSTIGISAGLRLLMKLGILPSESGVQKLLTDGIPPRKFSKIVTKEEPRIQNREALETILDYKFNNSTYLLQAITHASYPIKTLGSYQQLEFLGDAVLDFLVSSYIYEQCPRMDPGKLTDLRSALVNNVTLACVVVREKIHKFLLAENLLLTETIKRFATYQENNQHRITDQISLMETEDETIAAESVEVPKVLGDIFESIIGAVYLDSGLNLMTTWKTVYHLLKNEIHEFIANVPIQIVRRLFEFDQGKAEPKFFKTEVIDNDEVAVPLEINCNGDKRRFLGVGKNRELAKKAAAKIALKVLTSNK